MISLCIIVQWRVGSWQPVNHVMIYNMSMRSFMVSNHVGINITLYHEFGIECDLRIMTSIKVRMQFTTNHDFDNREYKSHTWAWVLNKGIVLSRVTKQLGVTRVSIIQDSDLETMPRNASYWNMSAYLLISSGECRTALRYFSWLPDG